MERRQAGWVGRAKGTSSFVTRPEAGGPNLDPQVPS